ncbi:hypothetical protein DEA98_29335 (plasmid) [Brucella pseudogrignonensis]|nr:hypothetical protein [Brucella pseudogrignonensis]
MATIAGQALKFDTDSGLGGSFTVEIVEDVDADRVKVRVCMVGQPRQGGNAGTNGTDIALLCAVMRSGTKTNGAVKTGINCHRQQESSNSGKQRL